MGHVELRAVTTIKGVKYVGEWERKGKELELRIERSNAQGDVEKMTATMTAVGSDFGAFLLGIVSFLEEIDRP